VRTVAGQNYDLSVDACSRLGFNGSTCSGEVLWNDTVVATAPPVFRDRPRRARPAHLPRGSMTMSGSSLAQQLAAVLRCSAVRRQVLLAKQIGR
jgi:hypothetical protein